MKLIKNISLLFTLVGLASCGGQTDKKIIPQDVTMQFAQEHEGEYSTQSGYGILFSEKKAVAFHTVILHDSLIKNGNRYYLGSVSYSIGNTEIPSQKNWETRAPLDYATHEGDIYYVCKVVDSASIVSILKIPKNVPKEKLEYEILRATDRYPDAQYVLMQKTGGLFHTTVTEKSLTGNYLSSLENKETILNSRCQEYGKSYFQYLENPLVITDVASEGIKTASLSSYVEQKNAAYNWDFLSEIGKYFFIQAGKNPPLKNDISGKYSSDAIQVSIDKSKSSFLIEQVSDVNHSGFRIQGAITTVNVPNDKDEKNNKIPESEGVPTSSYAEVILKDVVVTGETSEKFDSARKLATYLTKSNSLRIYLSYSEGNNLTITDQNKNTLLKIKGLKKE